MKNEKWLGTIFLITILILVAIGISNLASISYPIGQKNTGKGYYYLLIQTLWFVLGFISFFVTSKIDYKKYRGKEPLYFFTGIVLLILVLIMGIKVNGAIRWIKIGSISIQPSEFVKLSLILFLSGLIANYKNKKQTEKNIRKMVSTASILALFYIILIILEKSFSSTLQIIIIFLIILFAAGVSLKYFATILGFLSTAAIIFVLKEPYRLQRIITFFGKGSKDDEFQINQALIAIGSGEVFGKSYGRGLQKYFYIPEIHTDYIFSGYAEEYGFIGTMFLILLYLVLLGVIFKAILKIKDVYGKMILIGIFTMLATQILGHIYINLKLIPSTGITLPLLSYGGSTTLVVMASLGIVYNIIKSIYKEEEINE